MSVKIKISYEHPHELEFYLRMLRDQVEECKLKTDKEPYKTAYLRMKDMPNISEHR